MKVILLQTRPEFELVHRFYYPPDNCNATCTSPWFTTNDKRRKSLGKGKEKKIVSLKMFMVVKVNDAPDDDDFKDRFPYYDDAFI